MFQVFQEDLLWLIQVTEHGRAHVCPGVKSRPLVCYIYKLVKVRKMTTVENTYNYNWLEYLEVGHDFIMHLVKSLKLHVQLPMS